MKKFFSFLCCFWLLSALVAAQTPEAFHYQAVVRNKAGDLLKAQSIDVQISILKSSPTGVAVYQETHTTQTSGAGTIALQVGKGTPMLGAFNEIDWASGEDYFIHTTFTLNGETVDLGATQLLSVPYALYAQRSGEKHDLVLEGQTLSIKGGGASVTLPTSVGGGGDGGGSCLWKVEDIATATYPGSMALKNPSGNQYLKAYSDLDDAGHLRLNLAGKSCMEFDPGAFRMYSADHTLKASLLANNTGGSLGLNGSDGGLAMLGSDYIYLMKKKALASLCINDERGTGYLHLGENNSEDYSYLNLNYLTFSHNSNYTATLGGSSFGYLRLYNNQGKENVALGVVEGGENNSGWIGTVDPDGNDLIRLSSIVGSGSYQASIGLYYHGRDAGFFYVDENGRSVLSTDLLYVNGNQLRSSSTNYTETNLRSSSFSPCYVSESAGQITFRGTATLTNGTFRIVLPPEEAKKMTEGSVTIQLTPLSTSSKGLAVVQKENDAFTVAELQSGKGSYAFDWTLTALCKQEPQLRSGQAVESAGAAKVTPVNP